MRKFSIIVAFDQVYGIGVKGQLPWHLPADLKHFKEITTRITQPGKQNAVVMGRTTWESLPEKYRPLPQRFNIVLTRDVKASFGQGVAVAHSIDEALNVVDANIEEVFIIGGAKVYQAAIDHPACQALYVTHIKSDFVCDAFFPAISQRFMLVGASETFSENGLNFQFCHYLKHQL